MVGLNLVDYCTDRDMSALNRARQELLKVPRHLRILRALHKLNTTWNFSKSHLKAALKAVAAMDRSSCMQAIAHTLTCRHAHAHQSHWMLVSVVVLV